MKTKTKIITSLVAMVLLISGGYCSGKTEKQTSDSKTSSAHHLAQQSDNPQSGNPTEQEPNTPKPTRPGADNAAAPTQEFTLLSAAFEHEQSIPTEYSCDGADQSPPLHWLHPPNGVQSYVLIMDDPDAPIGVWDHWILFNIPPTVHSLDAAIPSQDRLEDGSIHGTNSWGRTDYGGPCPPSGTHRYFFRLYALDARLSLHPDATKTEVQEALKPHVLAETVLMGTFSRE